MRFGICPCCTVNTGVFDAYPYDDYINGGTVNSATYLWYRMPTVQSHASLPPGERYYSSIAAAFYWYVDLRDDIFVNYGNNIMSIAPLNTANEPVWMVRNESYGERQLFGSYNNMSGTGWTIGPDASVINNQLLCTTTGTSSGVYISQTGQISGTDAFHTYGYNFFMQVAKDFQKTFLVTVPNVDVSDGYRFWFNCTGTGTSFRKTEIISGSLFSAPTVSRFDLNDRYSFNFNFESEFGNTNTGTNIKIQLVDGTGLFTLSSGSGLAATIYNITYAGENSLGEFYDGIHPNYDIVLIDANNKTKKTLHKIKNNYYFSPFVSGSDMARYTNMTGNYWDEYTLTQLEDGAFIGFFTIDNLFQFCNFNNAYNVNGPTIDGFSDIFPRRYETFAHAINSLYTKSGFFSSTPYIRNTPTLTSCINSSGTKFALCRFPSNSDLDTDDDYAYKNNVTRYEVSNFESRFEETGNPSYRGVFNYDFIIELDSNKTGTTSTTGEIGFQYGERYNWGQIETDQFITGQLGGSPFHSGPIGNIDTNLPRINMMSVKDYPNCWSVIAPKQQFVAQDTSRLSISGAFGGHYSVSIQTGTLTENVKIFYGPITGIDYPVYFRPNTNIESGTTYSSQSGNPGNANPYYITGSTSEIFILNRHILHGATGELFWEDSNTGTRLFYAYQNTSGNPITAHYNSVSDFNIGVASGLMINANPTCSATMLWGDTKKGIRAGIFTHTRATSTIYGTYPYYFNNTFGYKNSASSATISGAGSPTQPWLNQTGTENLSGTSYIKVKIGNNIVFDKQVYGYNETKEINNFNYTFKLPPTTMPNSIVLGSETTYYERQEGYSLERARGLCAINDTESAQTMTGVSGVGFAWFERLWQTEPSYNNIEGVPTGWRLHVTDMSGNDIWSLDTTRTKYLTTSGFGTGQVVTTGFGPLTGTGNFGNIGLPTVLGSSNRFIYINGFFLCDERISTIDEFGNEDDGCAIYKGLPLNWDREPISGGGWSWAISHNGLSKFPIKVDERQFDRRSTVFCAENPASINDAPDSIPVKIMGGSNGFNLIDFVKDTTTIPYCPSLTQWGTSSCNTGSPMYYVTTGVWLASGEY